MVAEREYGAIDERNICLVQSIIKQIVGSNFYLYVIRVERYTNSNKISFNCSLVTGFVITSSIPESRHICLVCGCISAVRPMIGSGDSEDPRHDFSNSRIARVVAGPSFRGMWLSNNAK